MSMPTCRVKAAYGLHGPSNFSGARVLAKHGSRGLLCLAAMVAAIVAAPAHAQALQVASPEQQIAAAVLPLPEGLRAGATVVGYGPDLKLVTLRAGSNGMVCTGMRPGSTQFDVRCYHESFMPIVRRIAELREQGLGRQEIDRAIDAAVQSKRLALPTSPAAGYRMLGPASAYSAVTNSVGSEIESWQSIHFPYKTAAEIGLPEEGTVPRTFPYVMSSGTAWSHVMIEHDK
jgi:hypothetical protein